jgi:hypothetical protein
MHQLFHTANDNAGKSSKKPAFRLMETLRERKYASIQRKIGRVERELASQRGKKLILSHLERESLKSIVDEDEANWDSAMKSMERAAGHRKTLACETRSAAASMLGRTLFQAGAVIAAIGAFGASIFPQAVTGTAVGICAGAVALGAAIRTYLAISLGDEIFLQTLNKKLDQRWDDLMAEKSRLIRKLHGN